MNTKTGMAILTLALAILACRFPQTGAPDGEAPAGATSAPIIQIPSGTPPAQPVGIAEGLASLNSYRSVIFVKTIGPDPKKSTTILYETQSSKQQDARYTKMSQTETGQDVDTSAPSEYESYSIGNAECTNSGSEWQWKSMTPNEAEMRDLATSMLSVTPLIDQPTFVEKETVNGIAANHFSFKVSGLGAKSGANVTANQGDYWLAIDGQYIVKYLLVAETVIDPQANITRLEISIEVKDINQPMMIAFPQVCLDASQATLSPALAATKWATNGQEGAGDELFPAPRDAQNNRKVFWSINVN